MKTKASKVNRIKVKSFTIDRKKWYRGKGDAFSMLRTPSGKQCCLGFFARACGYSAAKIHDEETPEHLTYHKTSLFPKWMVVDSCNTKECKRLMATNDDESISDKARESLIRRKFKRRGVTVKFTG